jgi:hypothetical protein
VKPLARANGEKQERDRHKGRKGEQRVRKVAALTKPEKGLPLVQLVKVVLAPLKRHGGSVCKDGALEDGLNGEDTSRD